MAHVKTGLDRLGDSGFSLLQGKRTGLLVHPASVDARLRHAVDLAADSAAVDLRALFGPQHGILGQTQDNMIEWEGSTDRRTGVPVHSLYGRHRKPTPEMLADLDVLVIDLQDVGARYYTFIWTMLLCLETCAAAGVQVVVLDRPNPLGGTAVAGNVLDPGYSSFVGLAPLPMRHGLTVGELAVLFAGDLDPAPDLQVVWMEGWRREMFFPDTGLPWVLPSPNMPTWDTALVYPGGCLLEGTTLSEGRGTTRPFEIFGAPGIDGHRLASLLEGLDFPGVRFRPLHFEPTFHKHAGSICGGVQVHVTDRRVFESTKVYTAAVAVIRQEWPQALAWKEPPYEYETEKLPIDILAGGTNWRRQVEKGLPLDGLWAEWERQLASFEIKAAGVKHYD